MGRIMAQGFNYVEIPMFVPHISILILLMLIGITGGPMMILEVPWLSDKWWQQVPIRFLMDILLVWNALARCDARRRFTLCPILQFVHKVSVIMIWCGLCSECFSCGASCKEAAMQFRIQRICESFVLLLPLILPMKHHPLPDMRLLSRFCTSSLKMILTIWGYPEQDGRIDTQMEEDSGN